MRNKAGNYGIFCVYRKHNNDDAKASLRREAFSSSVIVNVRRYSGAPGDVSPRRALPSIFVIVMFIVYTKNAVTAPPVFLTPHS